MKRKGNFPQPQDGKKPAGNGPLANEDIRADKVQLIGSDGVNCGVVSRRDALYQAREAGLDLVMLAESGAEGVPVTKIMDYGKELYSRKKKQAEAKKHQKVIQIKEIKMKPVIGDNDYKTKMNQGIGFLEEGKKLKITLVFRKGREMIGKQERGDELFARVLKTFEERGLLNKLVEDKETNAGSAWSRIFWLKS